MRNHLSSNITLAKSLEKTNKTAVVLSKADDPGWQRERSWKVGEHLLNERLLDL